MSGVNMFCKNFAKEIKQARLDQELSQDDLAKLLGYTNSQFISNIERSLSMVPPKKMIQYAKLVKMPVEKFRSAYIDFHTRKVFKETTPNESRLRKEVKRRTGSRQRSQANT